MGGRFAYARLCKTIEPEVGATVLYDDDADNIYWRATGLDLPLTDRCDETNVPAAKKVLYTYDQRNWLKKTFYYDYSPEINRTYEGDGKLKTVDSNGTVWAYTYNKRRLLTKESLAYASDPCDGLGTTACAA